MSYEDYQRWKNTPIDGESYLSIVIPAYNEEVRIVPTIGAIAAHVSGLGFPWELLISDDGSKDATVTLVEGLGLANLHVIRAPKNEGKGSAVRRGMLAASGHYVLFDDADNSTPILLVEDDPFVQLVALEQLSVLGYAVEVASDGRAAVARLLQPQCDVDLVLMDCQMPGMDGYSATLAIRKWE